MEQKLQLALSPTPTGEFEILAITAGIGNGWEFSAAALQSSVPMWDKIHCFLDHSLAGRSIRDLAGVLYNPQWDALAQGIRATLRPLGPAAEALKALGASALENPDLLHQVGFSADLVFEPDGRKVSKIKRVISVDAVINPARGGQFIRVLNAIQERLPMPEETTTTTTAEQDAVRTLMAEEIEAIQNASTQAKAAHAQLCADLLSSGLAVSKLPIPMQETIRKQFQGKTFAAQELTTAIEDARTLLSQITASQVVQGPSRIGQMYTSADQIEAAVDDMFGVERRAALASTQAARLTGIRELYLMLTGDYDLHGGYYPGRLQLATTADFAGLVKNALNKSVVNNWKELGKAGYNWWEKITQVEHFNTLNDITGILVGTVGSLPSVAEGAEYTELAIGDSPETSTFTKYGGYIPLTLELIDRDETRKLRAYPRELANAALRNLSSLVAAAFTSNSAVGPTMADGGALFNATAVTTAGGHANLLTTALGTDYTAWNAVALAMYSQPMLVKQAVGYYGTGKKMALDPKYCLVPRALTAAAQSLFLPRWASMVDSIASVGGPTYAGAVEVVTVPEWTDATDWAAVADPKLMPGIIVGERFGLMPEIFIAGNETDPAVFMNDEHRMKVRHFVSVLVQDFRPLHKSNVA